MGYNVIQLESLVISSGSTASNALDINGREAIGIGAPSTVSSTITVMVDQTGSTSWVTLQSPPGTDVEIAEGKAIVLTAIPFPRIQLQSSTGEVGTRTFYVWQL